MGRAELPHDKSRFGPLRAAADGRPELVRLVALIQAFADAEDRALPESAGLVLDRLTGLDLFELRSAGDAQLVGAQQAFHLVFPGGASQLLCGPDFKEPAGALSRGPVGALAAMRRHWVDSPERDAACSRTGWNTDQCASLAVVRAQAEALFPEVFGQADFVQAPAPVASLGTPQRRTPGAAVELPPLEVLLRERAELEAVKHKAPTQALAEKYGCSKDTIERRINPDRSKRPAKAGRASPFDALWPRRA